MSEILNYFLPEIKLAMKEYYTIENLDFIDNFKSLDEIAHHLEADVQILQKFIVLVKPDKYMLSIYEYLYFNHVCTNKQLMDWYMEYYNTDPKNDQRSITNAIRRKINILQTFDIINVTVEDYGSRFPAYIYTVKDPHPEKLEKALHVQQVFIEVANKRNKKIVDNQYPPKEPKPEKSVEDITKEAVQSEVKDSVKKKVKQVTRKTFNCCAIPFTSQQDLDAHWSDKQTTFQGITKCRTCGLNWSEYCEHNCQYSFEDKKAVHLDQVKTLLEAKVSSSNLLTEGPE